MLLNILACIVCLFSVFLWRIRKGKQRQKGQQPPLYPGAWPIIGHSLALVGVDLWQFVTSITRYTSKAGGVARFYFFWSNYYYITDPEDCLTVMNQSFDKAYLYSFAHEWLGQGLVTADVTSWKKNRKLFNRAFTQRTLNTYLKIFNKQSRRLVNYLSAEVGKGIFNPYWYIVSNVLETSNETVLGLKAEENSMMDKDYVREVITLFDMIIERGQNPLLHKNFLFKMSDLRKRQYKIIDKMKAITFEVIRKRRSELQENNNEGEHQSLLDFALENFKESEGYTDEIIRQHLETFVIASFDSTSSTLAFALSEIGTNLNVQEEICKEIKEVFGDSDRDVDKDDISKLIYLDAVIKETIRLYPAIPGVAREIKTDVKLKNYTLTRGSSCVCSIYGVNRHSSWGEDANEFRPERWLESKVASGPLFAGFSLGKRNCIGLQYGLMSLKTLLVHIFRRYQVKSDTSRGKFKFNVFLKPASGFDIDIELRP